MDSIEVKRLKIVLLVSSIVCLVLLVLSAYEENIAGTWRGFQRDYREAAIAAASTDAERVAASSMEVGLRQTFLSALSRVDRCTTCHVGVEDPRMADAAPPNRTHSGEILKHHPVDSFGCTVCHDGQGRAVSLPEAHGEVPRWDEPLLVGEAVYTTCSRCHYENDPYGWNEDRFAKGGVHAPLNQAELAASMPPERPVPSPDATETPDSEVRRYATHSVSRGKRLFLGRGCLGCHQYRGRGGTLGPEITYVGDKTAHDFDFSHVQGEHTVAQWLLEHFKRPAEVSPGSVMPDLRLSDEQAGDLTNYMLSLHRKSMPASHTPLPVVGVRPEGRGSGAIGAGPGRYGPVGGQQLYAMFCSACHGPNGVGATVRDPSMDILADSPRELMTPSLNHPDTLAVASDDYLRYIISKGRSGTSMPAWSAASGLHSGRSGGLRETEIDRLVAFIRCWEPAPPSMDGISSARGNPRYGRALYRSRCAGCHGRHGEGSAGAAALNTPAFLAVASDEYLRDSIVYGRANTAMPSWKQLNADQVSDLLAHIRTWQAKPPDKQAVLDRLGGLGGPALRDSLGEHAEGSGKEAYQSRCARCHGSNGEGALAPALNNDAFLSIVDDDYLYTAIVKGRPGTAMPSWTYLPAEEVADLITHMRSWNDHHRRELEPFTAHGDWHRGRIFFQGACAACHGAGGEGGAGPQLNNPVFLASATDAMLREWISYGTTGTATGCGLKAAAPMGASPRSRHVAVDMTAWQIEDLISYLRRFESQPRVHAARTVTGDVELGAEFYADACASCHGPDEDEDEAEATKADLTNPDFLRAASDGYLEATIVLERSMHGLSLSAERVANVVAFIRSWEHDPLVKGIPTRYVLNADTDAGEGLFTSFCAGCHGIKGKGGWAPELNNREFLAAASDGFLQATIVRGRSETAMRPFGIGADGVAELSNEDINNIVAYIRTWADPDNQPND